MVDVVLTVLGQRCGNYDAIRSGCATSCSGCVGRVGQGNGAFGEVAPVRDLPFVVGLDQHGAGQAEQGLGVGKVPRKREVPPADDVGAALDLLVQPLQRVWSTRSTSECASGKPVKASSSSFASRSIASTCGNR